MPCSAVRYKFVESALYFFYSGVRLLGPQMSAVLDLAVRQDESENK